MTDYLHDRTGHDPEVAELEQLLAPYAHRAPLREPPPRRRTWRRVVIPLAALAVVAAIVLVVTRPREASTVARVAPCAATGPGFAFTVEQGEARCGGAVAAAGTLPVGAWLETRDTSVAALTVADIGALKVFGASRLRLVNTGAGEHRLELARGRISAKVVAPPRLFVIDTPSAEAVDLGCAYDLEVDAEGRTHLRVTSGEVSLEAKDGRVAYVPAGVEVVSTRAYGPGTPVRSDAPPALRAAVARFDAENDPSALAGLLEVAGPSDVITVWNLVGRTRGDDRVAVVRALDRHLPRPDGVSEAEVVAGQPAAIARWRQAIVDDWFGPQR